MRCGSCSGWFSRSPKTRQLRRPRRWRRLLRGSTTGYWVFRRMGRQRLVVYRRQRLPPRLLRQDPQRASMREGRRRWATSYHCRRETDNLQVVVAVEDTDPMGLQAAGRLCSLSRKTKIDGRDPSQRAGHPLRQPTKQITSTKRYGSRRSYTARQSNFGGLSAVL